MKKVALLMAVVFAVCTASFATSVASIKGTYNFQISGVRNEYGYYSGSNFVQVTTCPSNQHCSNQAFGSVSYGTLSFDGAGHVKFLSIAKVNNGSGGPTAGTVWSYSVSGYNGAMSGSSGSAYLTLGSFNSAGVAQVVTIRTGGNDANTGVATLQ